MAFDIKSFLFETPLYTKIEVPESENNLVADLLGRNPITVDYFNPFTKKESTFKNKTGLIAPAHNPKGLNDFYEIVFQCLRNENYLFWHIKWNGPAKTIFKIGQFPSLADYQLSQLKNYRHVEDKAKIKEFARAIGLAAHGVGIGSFVYLRRVFESLIVEAFYKAKEKGDVSDEEFNPLRMEDKIQMLTGYLPDFLVENRKLYSILSTGIHGLDEQTCLAYFETVKVGIELILDEKEEKRAKDAKISAAQKKIEKLNSKLKQEKRT